MPSETIYLGGPLPTPSSSLILSELVTWEPTELNEIGAVQGAIGKEFDSLDTSLHTSNPPGDK